MFDIKNKKLVYSILAVLAITVGIYSLSGPSPSDFQDLLDEAATMEGIQSRNLSDMGYYVSGDSLCILDRSGREVRVATYEYVQDQLEITRQTYRSGQTRFQHTMNQAYRN